MSKSKTMKTKNILSSNSFYEELILNMNEALWLGDKNEKTIYANPKFCKLVGRSLEDMFGLESYNFWDEESRNIVKQENKKRKKEKSSSYEGKLLTKTGEKIPVFINGTYLPDGGTIGIMTDLRELKKIDKKRRELESIINSSHTMTFIWDVSPERPVKFVSDNVVRLGYKPEEFYSGKVTYESLVHQDDMSRLLHECDSYRNTGKTEYDQEYRLITRSGEVRWVADHTVIREHENGNIVHQGIVLDITSHKKNEEKLFDMYRYLGVVNRKSAIPLNLSRDATFANKENTYQLIVSSCQNISDSDVCILYGFDKDEFTKLAICGNTKNTNIGRNKILKTDKHSILKSIVINKNRVNGSSKKLGLSDLLGDQKSEYMIISPIIFKNEILGIIVSVFENEQIFTIQEFDFMELFMRQVALVLLEKK